MLHTNKIKIPVLISTNDRFDFYSYRCKNYGFMLKIGLIFIVIREISRTNFQTPI